MESKENEYEYMYHLVAFECDKIKLLRDINVQCNYVIEALWNNSTRQKQNVCAIIDVAIPGDITVITKETEKVENYQDFRQNILKIYIKKERSGKFTDFADLQQASD